MSIESTYLLTLFAVSVIFLLFAAWLAKWVFSCDPGSKEMQAISEPIKEGANGFFKTQYTSIGVLAILLAVIIFVSYVFRPLPPSEQKLVSKIGLATLCTASFLVGGFLSGVSGLAAMYVAVRANVRVCAAAAQGSYNSAIQVAFRGGSFAAFLIVTLCLFGLVAVVQAVYTFTDIPLYDIPMLIVGYGFGASFVALFAQLGGGIYTKAADVGADIVGKVESDIPEDDPRNPAVIADLVGDNVGDCAGRGADLFESIAAENIGAMILGSTLSKSIGLNPELQATFTLFPLFIHAMGLLASAIGCLLVSTKDKPSPASESSPLVPSAETDYEDPMAVMKRGFVFAMFAALIGIWALCYYFLYIEDAPQAWWHYALCGTIGLFTSYLFVLITEYYTDYYYAPVQSIAAASETGDGTNVIAGVSVGLESTTMPVIVLSVALLSVYWLGRTSGLPDSVAAGIFGTAVATMGMLSTSSFILAMDTFGPISDNAGGIAEMSMQPGEVRDITDRLDAVGNTTKALTKGYAVGSAALAAFLLFRAYIDEINAFLPSGSKFSDVNLGLPEVFIAGLIGAALVYLFSGFAIAAVGKAAQAVVMEVRRQFKEMPGIMDYSQKPDYKNCVALVSKAALVEMVKPGLLAVLTPIISGFIFKFLAHLQNKPLLGVQAAAGLLMIGTIAGILAALFFNNAGGAWDNAKKYVELGNHGGKGSDAHKAAVTGDTVGDPFKDTAGPSLHVLIKLLSTLTLVFGPLFLGDVSNIKLKP